MFNEGGNLIKIRIMKAFKYLESEKIFIEVVFDYSESCRNVYKTFTVHKNGKKSNIRGLEKFLATTHPSILTQNTYFWNPSTSAGGRRHNESRRNSEVEDYFFKSEDFSDTSTFYLESRNLNKGEKFGIDERGYFLEIRKERYHFGFVKRGYNFFEARESLRRRNSNTEDLKLVLS